MARTARAARTVRRDEFVDVALRLIQAKGYEQMSVQDVLDELDASKGSFYHYFDSKRALLLAVVERMTDAVIAALSPVLEDPALTALQRLEAFLTGFAGWKAERRPLVLATIDAWTSDDNAIVREKLRRGTDQRLVPMLAAIVRQGVEEGLFTAGPPEETARILLMLVHGFREAATDQFFARRAGTISFDAVLRANAAAVAALERILGVPAGSIHGLDEEALRLWFG
jgi:AcrR family transcriptional regulator